MCNYNPYVPPNEWPGAGLEAIRQAELARQQQEAERQRWEAESRRQADEANRQFQEDMMRRQQSNQEALIRDQAIREVQRRTEEEWRRLHPNW